MSQTMQNRSLRIKALIFSSLSMSLFLFSACSDFKRAIGSEKSSPDEFEVVVVRHCHCHLQFIGLSVKIQIQLLWQLRLLTAQRVFSIRRQMPRVSRFIRF